MFGVWRYVLFLFVLPFASASPADSELQPRAVGDLCIVQNQRIALIGSRLYFMGGNYTYVGGRSAGPVSQLFWFNSNETFPVDNFIANSTLSSVDAPSGLTEAFDNQIESVGGAFFYDNTSLYLFSGMGNDRIEDHEMATYDSEAGDWFASSVEGGAFSFSDRQNLLYASVPQFGKSFALGGNNDIVKGFLKFDSSVQDNLTWTNVTKDAAGNDVPSNIGGAMIHVPMGRSGVLLVIGGADSSHKGTQYASGWPWDDVPMDQISVYDIDSDKWYQITASGDVPRISRSNFCYSVSRSPDSSSFQVTIYGGWNLAEGADTEDVYVLTVPSFRYIKMTTDNVEAVDESTGRDAATCATWNDAQMIVLGGRGRKGSIIVGDGGCDPTFPPIRVLDVSEYKWQSQFDPNRNYTVHSNISAVIGGDSSGKATVKAPFGGWNNTELENIFSQTVPPLVRATTSAGQTSSPNQVRPSATPSSSSSLSGGAIAGVVIGAITAATVLATLILFLLKKRRQRNRTSAEKTTNSAESNWRKAELPTDAQVQLSEAPGDSPRKLELDANDVRPMSELPAGRDVPVVHEVDLEGG